LSAYFERQTVTLTVTLAELRGESSGSVSRQPVDSSVEFVELARGIEPPTGGLQTNEVTNEDDVSLCKITNHDLE
ncbi:MAG: hypothetical protein KIT80_24145, partial [Chitinophagaceae bacterium]|nr:hypothetical protein [Chitinophagaceae bacterium]